MTGPAQAPLQPLARALSWLVIALALAATGLILLIPRDSLDTALVYKGF
jgi:hypothetical protein